MRITQKTTMPNKALMTGQLNRTNTRTQTWFLMTILLCNWFLSKLHIMGRPRKAWNDAKQVVLAYFSSLVEGCVKQPSQYIKSHALQFMMGKQKQKTNVLIPWPKCKYFNTNIFHFIFFHKIKYIANGCIFLFQKTLQT